ncbi:MAG: HAD hydrolase-like protein [Acidimicrobiia bacterium]|nr:HAD hydrolase-like protein [Acidimicrobiia bacterium]
MTLLIDADDTLWENIRVFHDVNASFVEWIAPAEPPSKIRSELDAMQIEFVGLHGYGRRTFQKSLLAAVERFGQRAPTPDDHSIVETLVSPLRWDTLDLIEGVTQTLAELRTRHDLIMMTKGDHEEQSHKVARSGLGEHFVAVEIVAEKNVDAYKMVVDRHDLDLGTTWMIGNSPRSDILPALHAGLGAVHIPHDDTWGHEHDDLDHHPRLMHLPSFDRLLDHF